LVLALVLGGRAEVAFRQAILGSQGALSIFFSNMLVGWIMTFGLVMLFWPAISFAWGKVRGVDPDRHERRKTV
jgi:putative tricarboxylic transport membrane protein